MKRTTQSDFAADERWKRNFHRAARLMEEAHEWEALGEYDIADGLEQEAVMLMKDAHVDWGKDGRYWPGKYESSSGGVYGHQVGSEEPAP